MSGTAIAGYALLGVAALLLLVGGIRAVRRRRLLLEASGSDLPAVGAAVTPPERDPVEDPALDALEHEEPELPSGGPVTDPVIPVHRPDPEPVEEPEPVTALDAIEEIDPEPSRASASPAPSRLPLYDGYEHEVVERRRGTMLIGGAALAAGAAIAWMFSRKRRKPEA